MKFLLLLPLGMIVPSLAKASLMKGAVKTWVTCKCSNKFGFFLSLRALLWGADLYAFSPESFGKVSKYPPNIPSPASP